MATKEEQNLDTILDRIEKREKTARKRAILYTMIPIIMAFLLLGYSSIRIQREAALVREFETRTARLIETSDSLSMLLSETVELSRYMHPIGFIDLKAIASRYPREAGILNIIIELKENDVRWRLGGQRPDQGFDSPSFAMFVLSELGIAENLIRPGESLHTASRHLSGRLPEKSGPDVGDIVLYPMGYYLFYFKDERDDPFVIGMTPMGIIALNPDFSNPVGYRSVQF